MVNAKRRDGIKDLSQRRVLSTHRLESKRRDSSVYEASCDVLWSAAVRCYEFVRDVHWGCSAHAVGSHGLLANDSSMEAEHGCLLDDCGNDIWNSGGSASI